MKHIKTLRAPEPGFYSQGVLVDPKTHTLLFLSGQTANIPGFISGLKDEPVIDGGLVWQTTQTLENLLGVVIEAGGDVNSFVALDVFLKDPGFEKRTLSRKEFAVAYETFFRKHNVPKEKLPARCLLWVSEVPLEYPVENTIVEIKGVAAIARK